MRTKGKGRQQIFYFQYIVISLIFYISSRIILGYRLIIAVDGMKQNKTDLKVGL